MLAVAVWWLVSLCLPGMRSRIDSAGSAHSGTGGVATGTGADGTSITDLGTTGVGRTRPDPPSAFLTGATRRTGGPPRGGTADTRPDDQPEAGRSPFDSEIAAALCEQPGGAARRRSAGGDVAPGRSSKFNRLLAVGDLAPDFAALPGIDGRVHALAEWQDREVVVLMFVRSLCPSTHAHEERLRQFAAAIDRDRVALIAVSVSRNPAEGLERMAQRATQQRYDWPWLCDLSQRTAREYGATVTPQFFVLDRERRVAYMGAFDNDLSGKRVTRTHVADAVSALLRGAVPPVTETLAKGCDIELAEDQSPRQPDPDR